MAYNKKGKKKGKLLGEGEYFKSEHESLGTWFFSSPWTLIDFCDMSYSAFWFILNGYTTKSRTGWKISIVQEAEISTDHLDPQ